MLRLQLEVRLDLRSRAEPELWVEGTGWRPVGLPVSWSPWLFDGYDEAGFRSVYLLCMLYQEVVRYTRYVQAQHFVSISCLNLKADLQPSTMTKLREGRRKRESGGRRVAYIGRRCLSINWPNPVKAVVRIRVNRRILERSPSDLIFRLLVGRE